MRGHTGTIDQLLISGANVNAVSSDGHTPLMVAAAGGHREAVELLIENGANYLELVADGLTAAQIAKQEGHDDLAAFLSKPPQEMIMKSKKNKYVLNPKAKGNPLAEEAKPKRINGETLVSAPTKSKQNAIPTQSTSGKVAGAKTKAGQVPVKKVVQKKPAANELLTMRDYREDQLPFILEQVDGEQAQVRVLYGDQPSYDVQPGDYIGETPYKVVNMKKRTTTSKGAGGGAIDVSRMVVQEDESGELHLLVKDVPAKTSDSYAVVEFSENGQEYDVRPEDEFSVKTLEEEVDNYRVVAVRPTQVVLLNKSTEETFTIARNGNR